MGRSERGKKQKAPSKMRVKAPSDGTPLELEEGKGKKREGMFCVLQREETQGTV